MQKRRRRWISTSRKARDCRAGRATKFIFQLRICGARNCGRRSEAKFVNAREELSFGAPNFDIEDYSFVNVEAEYEINPHFTIFGRIDNLTNEQYAEVFGFPALGRGAYGGFRLSF